MKRVLYLAILIIGAPSVRAQVPVIDAAALAEAVAATVQLRKQIKLIIQEVELARQIHQNAAAHLRRYEQSLRARGAVHSEPLRNVLAGIESRQFVPDAITYAQPAALRNSYRLHDEPVDPVRTYRTAANRTMATLDGVLGALAVHKRSLSDANSELENFKTEIDLSTEPRQIMDVQASLQIVEARELMLTRQALMTLANLEAVKAAEEISRHAQEQARYEAFIGGTQWLGDPRFYRVDRFLRMPGDQ